MHHFKISSGCSERLAIEEMNIFKKIRIYPNKINAELENLKPKDVEYLLELLNENIGKFGNQNFLIGLVSMNVCKPVLTLGS